MILETQSYDKCCRRLTTSSTFCPIQVSFTEKRLLEDKYIAEKFNSCLSDWMASVAQVITGPSYQQSDHNKANRVTRLSIG